MRRTSLSRKLLLAALPLLAAVGVLLAFTIRTDVRRANEAQRDAELGKVSALLLEAVDSVVTEQNVAIDAMLNRIPVNPEATSGADADALDEAAAHTDAQLAALVAALDEHHEFDSVNLRHSQPALDVARRLSRAWAHDRSLATVAANTPFRNYETALRELSTLSRIVHSSSGNPVTGRSLLAVGQFTDAGISGAFYQQQLASYLLNPKYETLIDMRSNLLDASVALDQFETTVTPEWAARYRRSGIHAQLSSPLSHVNTALARESVLVEGVAVDIQGVVDSQKISTMISGAKALQDELVQGVIDQSSADASAIRRDSQIRIGVIAGATLAAIALAFLISRSITRRVRAVAQTANVVANEQLPGLVASIRDPRGGSLPEIQELDVRGTDEVAELAGSFNSLQQTLRDVAEEQVAVLRRGVSDIFVTMARRNRSLVDRQLALLDEFEAEVEDPDVLASYYQIDHLATRMRRNSESLLVLANAEARRGRVGPTDVTTVVRAAIGEIEDYRRVQVEEIEELKVRGPAVADIAHLLAELLDNAAAFSPPETIVRVGGRRVADGYQLRINDAGVGIPAARLDELNDLLRNPPIVGLSVEPTLGMSVVSLLAKKHGVQVTLIPSNPGLTVDVLLPESVFSEPPAAPEIPAAPAVDDPAEAALIAQLEAGFAAPDAQPERPVDAPAEAAAPAPVEPSPLAIDPSFSARLHEAFDRSELTTPAEPAPSIPGEPFTMPVRGRETPPPASFPIPTRDRTGAGTPPAPATPVAEERIVAPGAAGATTAASAFASFQAGLRAATGRDDTAAPESVEPAEPAGLAEADPTTELPATPAAESGVSWTAATPTGPAVGLAAPSGLPTRGGFAIPAPPVMPTSPSLQPVAPAHATPPPPAAAPPSDLPSRNRAAAAAASSAMANDPNADEEAGLAAALAAFDRANAAATAPAEAPSLPSRGLGGGHYQGEYRDDDYDERPESTTVSGHTPEQLRARLRAFQTEFRTGSNGPGSSSTHTGDL